MKRCKCISTSFFDKIDGVDYDVKFGDIRYYRLSDAVNVDGVMEGIIEILHKNVTVVYMLERDFKKTFIDLTQYRIQKIKKLLNNEH